VFFEPPPGDNDKSIPDVTNSTRERDIVDNGVERTYEGGYSEMISFTGYSSTALCTRYNRTEHVNGHTKCPLVKDWYQMWRPTAEVLAGLDCWKDDMIPVLNGKGYKNAPGTTTILGNCPPAHSEPDFKFKSGQYDFRYGGIRPQDNPEAALYPLIVEHIEKKVADTGKKVVVKGTSGGTINGYAFLMSQTQEWRQKHVMAFIAMSPVFGGTISSINSVLHGWQVGAGDLGRCIGRSVAIHLPSVLWMWPHPGTAPGQWNQTEVLVQTPTRNYTAYDLDRLLVDIGLAETQKIYDIEKNDYLGAFAPPMIDTYAYYGFGSTTTAGYKFKRNFSKETDGPDVCPPSEQTSMMRPWDDGDVTAPRRSCSRAQVWAKPHADAGFVLKNYGYKGQKHSGSCTVPECTKDYNCMMAKLEGKPPPAGCT